MPAVGSSIGSRRGRLASAIANSTRLTSPYASTLIARSACSAMPTLAKQHVGVGRELHAPDARTRTRRACGQRELDVPRTVSEAKSRRSGTCGRLRRQTPSGFRPTSSTPPSERIRRRGELAADHVEARRLARPVRSIKASIRRRRGRSCVVDGAHAAERLGDRAPTATRSWRNGLADEQALQPRRRRAEREDEGEHGRAEKRAPVVGLARDRVHSQVKSAAPTHGPEARARRRAAP